MSSHKNNSRTKTILFLVPYSPGIVPGQRFRFEQYFSILKNNGFDYEILPFFSSSTTSVLYKPGFLIKKILALWSGFISRIFSLRKVTTANFIFIFREITPVGPPFFEWLISRVFKKKIIYDFDDAIWLTDRKNESAFFKLAKWRSKVKLICKWSYKVSCGNPYLLSYALKFNAMAKLIPTTIDTEFLHNPSLYEIKKTTGKIVIGWTGSHSTLKYLEVIKDVLSNVTNKHAHVQFIVIADRPPEFSFESLTFVPWSIETEMQDLLRFDIGIMPLPDDKWTKGKCGFKALQYMALNIPTVVSPVGVNLDIIDHNRNGFLAESAAEWAVILEKLVIDEDLRLKIGRQGREKVLRSYSVISNSENFLSLFT